MRNSRLIGGKPKIGIRPIIDGRRGGIRESLEDMTMAMAHKVAELYSSVLRHSDGTSVECVIADTTLVEWLKLPWRLKNSVIVESVLYFL